MRLPSLAALALALLVSAVPASAQATFGVKLGINAATVSFEDEGPVERGDREGSSIDKQARLEFVGGLTEDIPISPAFSFRPEVLYSQKGYAAEFDIDGGVFDGDEFLDVNGTAYVQGRLPGGPAHAGVPLPDDQRLGSWPSRPARRWPTSSPQASGAAATWAEDIRQHADVCDQMRRSNGGDDDGDRRTSTWAAPSA